MGTQSIYQCYAELEGYQPKMWRRFQIFSDITVARLGYIVMTMFEMEASHLLAIDHERHLLTPSGKVSRRTELINRYDIPDEESDLMDDMESEDATAALLSEINFNAPSYLTVRYDFGDGWKVLVKLEKIIKAADLHGTELPCVIEGEGFGIIEDCGGVWGLEDLAEAFKQKKGETYEDYREWLGVDDLDLATFDKDDMNFRLKKLPDIYEGIYEEEAAPSQASFNIIKRKYLQKPKKPRK